MKNFLKLAVLLVAGLANSLSAFTYTDSDLLLVFRKSGYNDVLFNLGNVSNYLGRANGEGSAITNFDFASISSGSAVPMSA